MLKRVYIKGYKSLTEVEVRLSPLTLLFGPNAAGKSNFLDALQLLSKLSTSRTLKEAFDPPYRGKPLESFTIEEKGLKGMVQQERLVFSIEADLELSDAVIEAVNRQIREMRRPSGIESDNRPAPVRERNLRYRVEIEMRPQSGTLCVTDEYLTALNDKGEPTSKRRPFVERQGGKIHLRLEGQAHPRYYERYLDHTILSMPHYPPHYPHLVAARRELERWQFFYFEPRERMRAANPVKEVRHIGLMGEELAAFLNTLKIQQLKQFEAVEKALRVIMHSLGIEDIRGQLLGLAQGFIDYGAVYRDAFLKGNTRESEAEIARGIEEAEKACKLACDEVFVHGTEPFNPARFQSLIGCGLTLEDMCVWMEDYLKSQGRKLMWREEKQLWEFLIPEKIKYLLPTGKKNVMGTFDREMAIRHPEVELLAFGHPIMDIILRSVFLPNKDGCAVPSKPGNIEFSAWLLMRKDKTHTGDSAFRLLSVRRNQSGWELIDGKPLEIPDDLSGAIDGNLYDDLKSEIVKFLEDRFPDVDFLEDKIYWLACVF